MRQLDLAAQTGRGLDRLEFLGSRHTFDADDLARAVECSRRHAYRILAVLKARNLAEPDETVRGRWRQGPERVRGFAR